MTYERVACSSVGCLAGLTCHTIAKEIYLRVLTDGMRCQIQMESRSVRDRKNWLACVGCRSYLSVRPHETRFNDDGTFASMSDSRCVYQHFYICDLLAALHLCKNICCLV